MKLLLTILFIMGLSQLANAQVAVTNDAAFISLKKYTFSVPKTSMSTVRLSVRTRCGEVGPVRITHPYSQRLSNTFQLISYITDSGVVTDRLCREPGKPALFFIPIEDIDLRSSDTFTLYVPSRFNVKADYLVGRSL